jgi:probable F420-dependent oxidoreductase
MCCPGSAIKEVCGISRVHHGRFEGAQVDRLNLGPVGAALYISPNYLDEAAELESLGYSAIWLPGGQIDDLSRLVEVTRATTTVPVASAVVSLDVYPPGEVAALAGRLQADMPGRFVLGLGGPQNPRPLRAVNDYLDHLDNAEPPVPAARRLLAALGPRKLELARDRAAGAIMLLVTPEHTAAARRILGDGAVLVIDQMVVPDTDAARARRAARRPLQFLSGLPGYRASFARMGFTDADMDGLSDTLVDQLVIWGDTKAIAARVTEHLRAGADHVILHTLNEGSGAGPMDVARRLARLLG